MRHILIVDDHEVTRRGLRDILRDVLEHAEISEAADGTQAVAKVASQHWDLILLDILMPGVNVIDVIRRIRAQDQAVPVLIVTAASESEYVIQTMKAGANGLIHKHRASDELIDAIKQVAAGGTYLHPETAVAVAQALRQDKLPQPHDKLSERELSVFKLIAQGRSLKQIGGDLKVSEKTVATYLARIREKTGLMTYVEIARYAIQNVEHNEKIET